MDNWFADRDKIKRETARAIMNEFEYLLKDEADEDRTANYWIDNTHNVFAFINDNGGGDRWIQIHYELYDCNEDIIGDLLVLGTEDVDREELLAKVKEIVDIYYGD